MELRKYIHPILSDNYCEGCGVMVGNKFITAGHVIENAVNPSIIWNGEHIPLSNPIVLSYENDAKGYDVAIYSIPNVNSPLILSNEVPVKGNILKICSWRKLGEEYVECNALVNGIKEGNYYAAETEELLKRGSSGSPVFLKDDVVGIICKGNCNDDNTPCHSKLSLKFISFLSSQAIIELLDKNQQP